MGEQNRRSAEPLLESERERRPERERRVIARVFRRTPISRNVSRAFEEPQIRAVRLAKANVNAQSSPTEPKIAGRGAVAERPRPW
jgi:hypothetical protein